MKVEVRHKVEILNYLKVGCACYDEKGRLAYIIDGQWEIDGRLSNFWDWKLIKEDGTLGRKQSGYGWKGKWG